MVDFRIFFCFLLVVLVAPCCNAQQSNNSTIRYFSDSPESDFQSSDVAKSWKIHPSPMEDYGSYSYKNKFESPGTGSFLKEKQQSSGNLFDRQIDKKFGSDLTFSVRTPSAGVFNPKNNKDDVTEYKTCISKTLNYSDQNKCNIEILLGKKFNL